MERDFNAVWLQYSRPVKEFLYNQTRNHALTDDLLQDVFLKIHMHLPTLKADEKMSGWVFQIARNMVLNHYRSQKKQLQNQEELQALEATSQLVFQENNLNQMVAFWLSEFKNDLDPKYQEAIQLVDIEGVSQIELARRLGLSVSAAKSRVQRGRAQLRQKLMDCCPVKTDAYGNIIEIRSQQLGCVCTD